MNRRKFIHSTAAAVAALTIPVVYSGCGGGITNDPLLRPDMLAHFCDEETIRKIGQDFLKHPQNSAGKNELQHRITQGYAGVLGEQEDRKALREWIRKKIEQEFINEKTVVVGGWVLSETEACQCALLSLS